MGVAIIPAGQHLIATAVKMSSSEVDDVTWTWTFDQAAWLEPAVADEQQDGP
jgi:hypothetical protein